MSYGDLGHLPRPVTHSLSRKASTTTGGPLRSNQAAVSWSSRFPRKSAVQKSLLAALVTMLLVTFLRSSSSIASYNYTARESAWLLDDSTSMEFSAGQGQIVGAHGTFFGIKQEAAAPEKQVESRPPVRAAAAGELLQGLHDFPLNNPRAAPLTKLGIAADQTFKLGPTTRKAYVQALEAFIKTSWPEALQKDLLTGLERYTDSEEGSLWKSEKIGSGSTGREKDMIWMTDKQNGGHEQSADVLTWKDNHEGWEWKLLEDRSMNEYADKVLGDSRFGKTWNTLPNGIRRSDTIRYLLLLLNGGIYSDTDTKRLKLISYWGKEPTLWKDGKGWLSRTDRLKMQEDGGNLPPPSVIVGIEADVGEDREDWNQWWPRPLQIVQWTLASAPSHPIFLDALYMIQRQTAYALQWENDKEQLVAALEKEGKKEQAKKVWQATFSEEPEDGGPMSVMEWTGPGLFSDSVLRYLRVKYGLTWPDLRGLDRPLRIGDVVILPVTGFSPNVGLFGAQASNHEQAMVAHQFAGSWKKEN